ncbi:hypothetical protein [Pyxidicoccus fallax]|nr:hypothetical protein [Pyxidicoccus fallax]
MRKVLFLGALALGASACDPDIAQDPPPPAVDLVVAEFDPAAAPAVVPTPNDLAMRNGLVNAPVAETAPEAEKYFTREYLNTLDGFPTSVSASTTVKDADPTTVNDETVKILDLYAGTPLSRPVPRDVVIGYHADTDRVNVLAPSGWPKGGRYAVVLVGGEKGIKSTSGKPIVGSSTWAFASSQEPLVTCEDLTAPNCRAATEIIPATETDPARRLAQQTAIALQLEQLRRNYAPVLDEAARKFSIQREDIVLAWTFTIMNRPEVTFDLTTSTVPFPNDLLRVPAQGQTPAHLNLPEPGPGASPLEVQLIGGLNSLDGWSTTAPIISENSPSKGFIDAAFNHEDVKLGDNVLFINLKNLQARPNVRLCFNCMSSVAEDGTTQTLPQLQIVPNVPLDEATSYAVVIKKGLRDRLDRPVEPTASQVLLRSPHPLFANGKSQVSVLPDPLAQQLEQARLGMKPLYDALEQLQGIKRNDVNLAWVFTTQTTRPILERLNAAPEQVPADPMYLDDVTLRIKGQMEAIDLESDDVGRVFTGAFVSPFLLSDRDGVLNRAQPRIDRLPFLLFLPATAAPETGYPVVVFGHGLTGNHTNVLTVANTLNKSGFAVAAMDTVFHGERTSCAGITSPITIQNPGQPDIVIRTPNEACTEGSTCDTELNSPTYGRCVAPSDAATCDPRPTDPTDPDALHGDQACTLVGQGRCLSTGKCEGGDFKRPAPGQAPYISGWNFLNLTNLFATRDNFRHHVVDFAQFSRALGTASINARLQAAGAGRLNGAQVDYVGQSLGGLQGPLSASVSNKMRRVALNAAGGGLVDVLLTSSNPTFVRYRTGFNDLLKSVRRAPGTPAYDEFITLARTILDPADARNYAQYLVTAPSAPAGREAFIQYVKDDDVIPDPVTQQLITAANLPGRRTVQSYRLTFDFLNAFPANMRAGIHHASFGLVIPELDENDPGQAQLIGLLKMARDTSQGQVASFLQTGTAPAP